LPCVRSGPITEREEERDASPAMSIAMRILQNTEEQIPTEPRFSPKRIFRLLLLFRTCFTRGDLLISHTQCYIARHHSCVHNCSRDKPTNYLRLAPLRRARDVWIFTSTTPTPLRFEFIFQRSDKLKTALFWDIMQPVVGIPYRRFGTAYRSHLDH